MCFLSNATRYVSPGSRGSLTILCWLLQGCSPDKYSGLHVCLLFPKHLVASGCGPSSSDAAPLCVNGASLLYVSRRRPQRPLALPPRREHHNAHAHREHGAAAPPPSCKLSALQLAVPSGPYHWTHRRGPNVAQHALLGFPLPPCHRRRRCTRARTAHLHKRRAVPSYSNLIAP